ncbi:uncharacterized protein LOC143882921 [Tasmannia lanceolata]|uniref:uncharacterized protein LOC143882921 n=1 Tax=Tasmannia lanceolata TaxID=3420 RepID=UPI0040634121
MKQPYLMLWLLIPGPSAPENDIHVYLQPLIEELKELWEDGLQTYDASKNETLRMRAAVLWTISDFPTYANLSELSTKGKLACPSCNKDTCSLRLKHGKKEYVMHIEKNVCDNVIGTLLNIEGKPNNSLKARLDLQKMGIRRALHPMTNGKNKTYLPPACFTMSTKEKEALCNILKDVKVPDGFSSNISRRVNIRERKIAGLKSHDCHVLMQQLLPLAIRSSLPKKIFPPAFFDIVVHLPIHLADEARITGPVQYRWMYPIERYLLTLKSYVRNRSRVEGSIAEGYLVEECLIFCLRYLKGVESKLNRPPRNDEDGPCEIKEEFSMFSSTGRHIGDTKTCTLDRITIEQAHQYVLFNCQIQDLHRSRSEHLSEKLRWLADGPSTIATRYTGFLIKGFRFHTKEREQRRKTQNSGVVVTATIRSFSSTRDQNPIA